MYIGFLINIGDRVFWVLTIQTLLHIQAVGSDSKYGVSESRFRV